MATKASYRLLLLGLVIALLVSITAALALGPASVSPADSWKIVLHHLFGAFDESQWRPVEDAIVWELRLPRVLLGAVIGAMLALVGTVIQAMVRNPLADPYVLGAMSGASTGGVAVLLIAGATATATLISGGAFAGALIALIVVFAVARDEGRLPPTRLVLTGVAIGYALSGVTSFLILSAEDPRISQRLLFWLSGSLGGASWSGLVVPVIALILGSAYLLPQRRSLNALLAGDETARGLGVDTDRLRRRLLIVTSLLVGVAVAASGAIGFVGLMVPHAARSIVGAEHGRLMPVVLLTGAIFLIWVDVIARTILAPTEIPVGIITSVVGALVFVVMLRHRKAALGAIA